jgi:hypothetical protein
MKGQVKEQIVDNGGKIIAENDQRIQAEFSYREMEKAVRVFFQLTKKLNLDAILQGGYKLTVNFRNSEMTFTP